jgi:hypothetical protein
LLKVLLRYWCCYWLLLLRLIALEWKLSPMTLAGAGAEDSTVLLLLLLLLLLLV